MALVSSIIGVQLAKVRCHKKDYNLLSNAFKKMGHSGRHAKDLSKYERDVIAVLKGLKMRRYGPKIQRYEGLKVSSRGNVILASAAKLCAVLLLRTS